MTNTPDDFNIQPFDTPKRYELRVEERIGRDLAGWFEDMTVQVDNTTSPQQTIIEGIVRDQAALYGLISRLRDLGLTLLSVQRLDREEEA